MKPSKLISIAAGALVVLTAGAHASCSMIGDDGSAYQPLGMSDPTVELPNVFLDAGIRMEPPPVRADLDIGGEAVLPATPVDRPSTAVDPRPAVTPDVPGAPSPDLGLPNEERYECGTTVCAFGEQCCPGLGRCVPAECEDCCDRLVRGELPQDREAGPDVDPWPDDL